MKYIKQALFTLTILPIVLMAQPMVVLNGQKAEVGAGNKLLVTVEIVDVRDLDTYMMNIHYDHRNLRLIDAALDAPLMNIRNVLRSNERTLLPVIKKEPGTVSIAATLTGEKSTGFSECGVVGILVFEVIGKPWGKIALNTVELLDSNGKKIECGVASD